MATVEHCPRPVEEDVAGPVRGRGASAARVPVPGACRARVRDLWLGSPRSSRGRGRGPAGVRLRVARALLRGAEPRDPGAWLATIARNESWARARRQQSVRCVPELRDVAQEDPSTVVVRRSELARIWQAIEGLPASQREALLLREVRGLGYDELAADLQVSHPSVRSLLNRARRTLGAQLEKGAAALTGAPWLTVLARFFDDASSPALSSASRSAAVGLGVLAIAGGAVVAPSLDEHAQRRPAAHGSTPRGDLLDASAWPCRARAGASDGRGEEQARASRTGVRATITAPGAARGSTIRAAATLRRAAMGLEPAAAPIRAAGQARLRTETADASGTDDGAGEESRIQGDEVARTTPGGGTRPAARRKARASARPRVATRARPAIRACCPPRRMTATRPAPRAGRPPMATTGAAAARAARRARTGRVAPGTGGAALERPKGDFFGRAALLVFDRAIGGGRANAKERRTRDETSDAGRAGGAAGGRAARTGTRSRSLGDRRLKAAATRHVLLAGAHGLGLTIRGGLARTRVGERVSVQGARLHDGTIRMSRLQVVAHVRTRRCAAPCSASSPAGRC